MPTRSFWDVIRPTVKIRMQSWLDRNIGNFFAIYVIFVQIALYFSLPLWPHIANHPATLFSAATILLADLACIFIGWLVFYLLWLYLR